MADDDQVDPVEKFCRETEEAHEALIQAIHQMEVALLTATHRRDRDQWRARADQDVSQLIECLANHCNEAEEYGGLIAEMEYLQGKSEYLTRLQESHDAVLEAAQSLLSELHADNVQRSPGHWLRQLNALSSAVHEHEAREVDVIYETFWRDPVGGD